MLSVSTTTNKTNNFQGIFVAKHHCFIRWFRDNRAITCHRKGGQIKFMCFQKIF
ncbi:hypothetical protein Awo_c00500 [Acetobacterium woodii DSM 1030]|uniref:Uncharacterized protein n=1 Tax=Acetobacterium woodii (strain ATCC 29683 / DSM 1030 / JCM 2381 / KCTC 1655 / WB1) TaxID=931626 RepID=H6LEF0_ACEWD|nr:hypothetical protein Awo_c00500 [Acetobacterium woodii DSM 1030]